MLVSICMAVHNSAAFIRNTLLSVQNQTYKDFECIIVDDYSTDDTVNIIYEEFCKTDKRFKLFINQTDPNKPYVDSHNLSYELAQGKYLFRMDHDDEMFPDCVEFQVNFMEEHPEIDASCVNMLLAGENPDGTLDKTKYTTTGFGSKELCDLFNQYNAYAYHCNSCCLINPNSCLRKSFFDTVHPRYEILKTGDFVFWWRCLAGGARLYTHYEVKMYYRSSNHSLVHQSRFWTSPDENDYQILVAKYKASNSSGFHIAGGILLLEYLALKARYVS